MPIARLERTRATLPPDYQFGEGKWTPEQVIAAREVERRTSGTSSRKFRCDVYLGLVSARFPR